MDTRAERQVAAVRALLIPWTYDPETDSVPAKEDQGYYERQYINGPDAWEIRKVLDETP